MFRAWIAVIGVGISCVALVLSGYGLPALTLLAAGGAIASVRRGEAKRRVRVERFTEVAELPHSCDVVWAFIKPAESAPTWEPSIRRGYHVPKTPLGLGEQQAFESLDGTTTVIEIIEYEPSRRAVTTRVSPALELRSRNIYSLDPVEGGCTLSFGLEIDVPTRQRLLAGVEDAWRAVTRAQFERISQALAANESDSATEKS
jgi:hypothetical protein